MSTVNGFGDGAVAVADDRPAQQSKTEPPKMEVFAPALNTATGKWEVELPPRTLQASSSWASAGGRGGYVEVTLEYSTQASHLKISSDIETSYYKSVIAPYISLTMDPRQPHINPPDDKELDTVVSYVEPGQMYPNGQFTPSGSSGYYGGGKFWVQQHPFTNSSYSWTLTLPTGAVGGPVDGVFTEPEFNLGSEGSTNTVAGSGASNTYPNAGVYFGSDITGWPKSGTVNVTVTDAMPSAATAPATGKFTVKWHLPYENFVKTGQQLDAYVQLVQGTDAPEGQRQSNTNTFICTFEYDRQYAFADGIEVAGATFTLAASVAAQPQMLLILAGLGMAIENIDLGLVHANNVTVSEHVWNEAKKHNGFTPPGIPFEDCVMVEGYTAIYYDHHYYTYDAYDPHGFSGSQSKTARRLSSKAPIPTGKFVAWDDVDF